MATVTKSVLVADDLADSLLIELDTFTQGKQEQENKREPVPTLQDMAVSLDTSFLEAGKLGKLVNDGPAKDMIAELGTQIELRMKNLRQALTDYQISLEFTQKEVDGLKKENNALRNKIGDLEMEEKRNEFQVKRIDEKLDKQDTVVRHKNLIIEGIPEDKKEKENLQPQIYKLLDLMGVRKEITYDTAYRVGSYFGKKPRSIVITFIRISDRDEVYSKRANLSLNHEMSRVWINEDLGHNSRRAVNLIRMVARQAQLQGIPHRVSKYAIHIDNEKFDERNLEELPQEISLSKVKTVPIGDNIIAYQSEHSCFSNLYPVKIKIGRHSYTSAEQAFHHIRAVKLKKPVAASRILLTRDPYDIIKIGAELTATKEWEDCEDDIMFGCLLRKYEQNPHLLDELIATGDKELVEATLNSEWGAGVTLSSAALKSHTWKGGNKQGQIQMTVRDTLKNRLMMEEQEEEGGNEEMKKDDKQGNGAEGGNLSLITQKQSSPLHAHIGEEKPPLRLRNQNGEKRGSEGQELKHSEKQKSEETGQKKSHSYASVANGRSSPALTRAGRALHDGSKDVSRSTAHHPISTSTAGLRPDYDMRATTQSPILAISDHHISTRQKKEKQGKLKFARLPSLRLSQQQRHTAN